MFNAKKLILARRRRKMSAKALAESAGLSAVHLSRLENANSEPDPATVAALAGVLRYPEAFFYGSGEHQLQEDAVSFRSLRRTSVAEREAAKGAGELGVDVSNWLNREFNLPAVDLPDLGYESCPQTASRVLRQYWGLGERPIQGIIALLEAKGALVFSLAEETLNVDAFSFWLDDTPYVFLNTMKTPEHSVMDTAHELGHLVLHRPGNVLHRPDVEREANAFGSSFMMPREDVLGRLPRNPSVQTILSMKFRWRVSAMALAYRAHNLGLLTDWQYRSRCIDLTQRGIERETSRVWKQVLTHLWRERKTKQHIADSLNLPVDEIEKLTLGLTGVQEPPSGSRPLSLVG